MTSPHRPKSNAPAIWLAVGVVVVLLGIVAVAAARNSGGDDKDIPNQIGKVEVPGTTAPPTDQEPGSTATTVPLQNVPGSDPLPLFDNPEDDAAVGMIIPTIKGTDLQGEPMTIRADGKGKVIVFMAHWCPHCQREVPAIVKHLKSNPLPDDVELVGVSTGVDESAPNYPPSTWLKREGWKAPTLADTKDKLAASYYGLSGFPFFVAVDADGKVVYRTSGEIGMDQFDALAEAARTGESPV